MFSVRVSSRHTGTELHPQGVRHWWLSVSWHLDQEQDLFEHWHCLSQLCGNSFGRLPLHCSTKRWAHCVLGVITYFCSVQQSVEGSVCKRMSHWWSQHVVLFYFPILLTVRTILSACVVRACVPSVDTPVVFHHSPVTES